MRRGLIVLFVLALLQALGSTPARANGSELRAWWVDAFGEGIFSEAQVDKLVAAAKAANLNALVVQVGRRGDCFCNRAIMPRTQAAIARYRSDGVTPYDPLDVIIEKAHAAGIQVHAWIITTAIWNSLTPPLDPDHVFNLHGPSKTGVNNWLMLRSDGANRAGADYLLDPGHPDAADYIVKMYTSVAENYDIDGLNFDRVRYPDTGSTALWGYNPVAVARFQAFTHTTAVPAPTDPVWMQWRRDQVTNIVRKVYVETYATKPHLRISADTITYGYGPASVGGWEATRTYREVLQDWRGWMEEGILDTNFPMNYKRDHFTTEPNNQRRMYDEWDEFAKDNQFGRDTAIGSAIYLNYIAGSVSQIRKALAPSAAGNTAIGWLGYSYRSPDCLSVPPYCPGAVWTTDQARAALTVALTQPSTYDPITPPVFAAPATVPGMAWKSAPTRGHIAGLVITTTELPIDQILVDLLDPETDARIASRWTDGMGYFAFVDVSPGRYKLFVEDDARVTGKRVAIIDVTAGAVTRVEIMPFAKGAEGRRPMTGTMPAFVPSDAGPSEEFPNGER
jgi:uncharacterized lipoprotein YddW (UPF0748 family)